MLEPILSAMRNVGFEPSSDVLIDDGKLRRFKRTPSDKGKDSWVVLHRFNDRQGGVSHVAVWGDWHDCGEVHKYSTLNSSASAEDRELIKKQIEKAKKKADEETERDRAELRAHCLEYLPTLGHEITEYAKVKGLTSTPYSDNGNTIIPVTDGSVIHGYQIIQPDGSKRFKLHTVKKGNFYAIGKPTQRIWVCEGWATGQTVHEATGEYVIVCFDAGNVESVVSRIRASYPRSEFFLAGDNDEAGLKINLTGYFPETPKNDWNDEYQMKGLEYVREQLQVKKQEPIRCLGFRNDSYFYTSDTNRQIVSFTASSHSNNNLLNLMPLEWWSAQFPKKEGVDWTKAYSWMMQSSRGKGIFSPKNIRGTGVWEDNGLKVNCGYQVHPFDPLGRYTYVISDEVPPPSSPATQDDVDIMIDVIQSLSWKHDQAWKLFAGWLIVAPFSGVLQWRPHMWLTGGAGAGKSTVMEDIASSILGPYKLYMRGATTEAGIRQSMAHNALPIIFDEFETTDRKTGEKNKSVLDLLRQASSESTSEIIKGSSGGDAIQYSPKFCALVTSIRTTLENDADLSRFTVVELSQDKKPDFARIKGLFSTFDNSYSIRMFSRTYSNWGRFRAIQEALWTMLNKDYNARFAQQYSTLLAGYSLLSGESAEEVYLGFDFSQFITVDAERDQYECLNALINKIIPVEIGSKRVSLSIHEMIKACLNQESGEGFTYDEKRDYLEPTLSRYGIKVSLGTDNNVIYIRHSHPELARLFHGTKWAQGWARSLSRLPNAVYKSTTTIMKSKVACVSIRSIDLFDIEPISIPEVQ